MPMVRPGSGVFEDFLGLFFFPKQLKIDWINEVLLGPGKLCDILGIFLVMNICYVDKGLPPSSVSSDSVTASSMTLGSMTQLGGSGIVVVDGSSWSFSVAGFEVDGAGIFCSVLVSYFSELIVDAVSEVA